MERLLLTDGVIDLNRGEVTRGASVVRLTPNERELLAYLASRAGRDVSVEELHQQVWGLTADAVSRAVTLTVHRLRRKIELHGAQPERLVTGQTGYRWIPVPTELPPTPRIVLVVGEPVAPGDAAWLAGCAALVRGGGGRLALVDLGPDRVVLATPDDPAAIAAARALIGLTELRVGVAGGPAECLVDPVSGRTLYGGTTLERAAYLARAARPGVVPTAPADATVPARSAAAPRSDPLVGRIADLEALEARAPDGPVAIVGPAGSGKSRLAEALVLRLGRVAWTVRLEGVDTVDDALDRVVAAVGAAREADRIGGVGAALSVRGPVAVLLDGADGVAASLGDALARWRADAPEALFVVTSRDRTGLVGPGYGCVHTLGGLPVDEGCALLRARCPSVPADAGLERLVSALDGLPLALELVAPRLGSMAPDDLLRRLDRVLGAPSVRSALQDSWERLDVHQQQVLVRATVFAGRFGLDDAEAVLAADPTGPSDPDAPWFVDTLGSLCDRYLVQTEVVGDRRRFYLLATVRAFAAERGTGAARAEAERRHAERFGALLDRIPPIGRPQIDAAVLPDLALAVDAAARNGWADLAARCAVAYTNLSYYHEGAERSFALVDRAAAAEPDPTWQARLQHARSRLHRRSGAEHDALAAIRDALAQVAVSGDTRLVGRFEIQHGTVLQALGRFDEALDALVRGEAAATAAGDEAMLPAIRLNRAAMLQGKGAHAEGLDQVRPLLDAADDWLRGYACGTAGALANAMGALDDAGRWLWVGVSVFDRLRDPFVAANLRVILGDTLVALGRFDEAGQTFEAALAAFAELGTASWVVEALVQLAGLALTRDRPEQAGQWLVQAEPWAARCGVVARRGQLAAVAVEVRGRGGDVAGAHHAYLEAESLLVGRAEALGFLAVHRGMAAVAQGDLDGARGCLGQADAAVATLGSRPTTRLGREVRRLRRAIERGSRGR